MPSCRSVHPALTKAQTFGCNPNRSNTITLRADVHTMRVVSRAWQAHRNVQPLRALNYNPKPLSYFHFRYETASTRLFKRGRTETIRSCTSESADLAAAVCALDYDASQPMRDPYLYMLLTRALAKHKQLTQEAMAGQGCDRHIMGWRVAAWSLGLEVRVVRGGA